MTKDITVKNPSQSLIEVFNILKEKKDQQVKKLSDQEKCTVTIKV